MSSSRLLTLYSWVTFSVPRRSRWTALFQMDQSKTNIMHWKKDVEIMHRCGRLQHQMKTLMILLTSNSSIISVSSSISSSNSTNQPTEEQLENRIRNHGSGAYASRFQVLRCFSLLSLFLLVCFFALDSQRSNFYWLKLSYWSILNFLTNHSQIMLFTIKN